MKIKAEKKLVYVDNKPVYITQVNEKKAFLLPERKPISEWTEIPESELEAALDAYADSLVSNEKSNQSIADISLTRRQAFLKLAENGIYKNQIQEIIDELPENQKMVAQIEFDEAVEFARSHPLIALVGDKLNFNSEQLDKMFIEARKL